MVTALIALFVAQLQSEPPELEVQRDIVYHQPTSSTPAVQMDVFRPAGVEELPGVVMIHGGAWVAGKREDMEELAIGVAEEGFVVANVSYRLAPGSKWPAMLEDVQRAVIHLRQEYEAYGLDPDRIGAVGASAGAHLALLLGSVQADSQEVSSTVQAVVNIFGPTDLTQDYDPALQQFMVSTVVGKPMAEATEVVLAMSPVNAIGPGSPPVFTLHGTEDQVVPVIQATRLDEALEAAGVDHEMVIIEGMGHDIDPENPEVRRALEDAIEFLKKELAEDALAVAG